MLTVKSLKKARVASTLIPNPSAANLQSSRLALHVDEDNASSSSCWVYLASGCRVYRFHVPTGRSSLVVEGKESLLIPEHTQVLDAAEVKRCPHRLEIQSLALAEVDGSGFVLGSVDSLGHLIVSKLDSSSDEADKFTFSISPRDCGVGEGSWAGLCFNHCQWSMTAVARNFCKSIDVYDQDIHLRTMHTLWYPTSLVFMNNTHGGSEGSVLAVTEGSQLTIWDLRMKENGGCVQRTCGSVGDILYSVCSSSSGNIAVGGADRTVTIYDPRRWSAVSRWLNCSKYEDQKTKRTIGTGHEVGGLYQFQETAVALQATTSVMEWHYRLGHPSLSILQNQVPGINNVESLFCESCQLSKHCRTSFKHTSINRRKTPFELVHSDIWGPFHISSNKFRYFVTFIDDYSRMTWLYLLHSRSELIHSFQTFKQEIETQFDHKIKAVRTDNAKEYTSQFSQLLSSYGIIHESSCPYTSQQNGIAERKNRHLTDIARTLMIHMNVPKHHWSDAVLTACYLINRMPLVVLKGVSPFSLVCPTKVPFHLPLKIFGCVCYVHNLGPGFDKFDARATKCVFLGYSRTQKGYRCYNPRLNKYFVSSDVTFHEHQSFYVSPTTGMEFLTQPDNCLPVVPTIGPTVETPVPMVPIEEVHVDSQRPPITQVYQRRSQPAPEPLPAPVPMPSASDDPHMLPDDLPIALRKGTRSCTTRHPIGNVVSYQKLSPSFATFVSRLSSVFVPSTVQDALSHPGWKHAMDEEMAALHLNNTWSLVNLPSGKRPVGCRWVYTVKYQSDGSVERLKARLVAKGYTQTYGVDYDETFSPVAKISSIRLLFSLAANYGWSLFQLDVKNAFLHGDLVEEIYMEQPPGYVAQGESSKVCKLKKSLYGLKQSPRAWFGKFSEVVRQFGLKQCQTDHSVFHLHTNSGYVMLVVYVDDIVITGDDVQKIKRLKEFLAQKFYTKDLGKLRYFLGIEVATSHKGIVLSQRKYVLDLLTEAGLLGGRSVDTPMDPNEKLFKDVGDEFGSPSQYRRAVGKLNYLTITRPDISFAVSVVSQFLEKPRVPHWNAVIRIMRYLKKSPGQGLIYKANGHLRVEGYIDADWASATDRRSTTGYCTFLGGNLVTWKSKKQTVVSRSSAESEYRAMAQTASELTWIRYFLSEIGFPINYSIPMYCDNQAAIYIASNPVFHERTKHIEIDCHFVREKVLKGEVSTPFVGTGNQLADIFTKALSGGRQRFILSKLGTCDIYAPT